jgi:ABC-2 type transport system permease protein
MPRRAVLSPLYQIFALILKEFRVALLDEKSRRLLFAAPFAMLFVFSYAVTMEVKNASLAVLNQDAGDLGRRFISYFASPLGDAKYVQAQGGGARSAPAGSSLMKKLSDSHSSFVAGSLLMAPPRPPYKFLSVFERIRFGLLDRSGASGRPFSRVFRLDGVQDIRPAVENQEALMVLHIPRDFSKKLESGQGAAAQIILDGRKVNAAQIAAGYADAIARQFVRALAQRGETGSAPLDVAARYLFNPNQSYLWFTLPVLLALLTQMIALVVSGMSVARERELGTLDQLLVSPLSSAEVVAGKIVPAALLAFGEGVVIHGIALTVFGVPFAGSLALLAGSFGLFILSVTGVGLFISSLCATQQQAFLGCFTYMVPSVLLSGFVSPVENMPRALQILTLLNPLRHAIKAVLGIYLKGAPVSDVVPEMVWLGGIAAAAITFSAWFFKRKTQ